MEKYYHRRKVQYQRELAACQTPCEAAEAAATDVHSLGCHETVIYCVARTSNASYSTILVQVLDSRKVFRDHHDVRTPRCDEN